MKLAVRSDPQSLATLRAIGEHLLHHCERGLRRDATGWRLVPGACRDCQRLAEQLGVESASATSSPPAPVSEV